MITKTFFPKQFVEFFDATTVHPAAKGFQLADYDEVSQRVIFYPWGSIVSDPGSVFLAYHTDRDFLSSNSYDAVDLKALVSPDAQGFGCGFTGQRWAYFVPYRKNINTTIYQQPNDMAMRFNLDKDITDPTAYETIHLNQLPIKPPKIGWITGCSAGGYSYYAPFGEATPTQPFWNKHGIFLRYNQSLPFDDPAAWEWYDLTQVDPGAQGFQTIIFKNPYVYLVPYDGGRNGANVLVRYDITKSFIDKTSYQTIKLTDINPGAVGYTGAIVAGNDIVLVPWRDLGNPVQSDQGQHLVAKFDTRFNLTNYDGWSFFDLKSIDQDACGYQFGWVDATNCVHLSPTFNFATGLPPPFMVWNSTKPFTSPTSWKSYPNDGDVCTGAGYDANHAWLSPYGRSGVALSGKISKVTSYR